jgi:hypothetical protein
MTRNDIVECLPSTPYLPVIILCDTEDDIDQVKQVIVEVHGSRYINDYDVRVVENTQENRDMMRSMLCLAFLDTSCMVL